MSAEKFTISYPATAQLSFLPRGEKAALTRFFSSDQIDQPATTRATDNGRFVSRLGTKLVVWRRSAQRKPEILSILDQSFTGSG